MPDATPQTTSDAWEQAESYLRSREGALPREVARQYKTGHDRGFAAGKAGRDQNESLEQVLMGAAGTEADLPKQVAHTYAMGHSLGYQAGAAAAMTPTATRATED